MSTNPPSSPAGSAAWPTPDYDHIRQAALRRTDLRAAFQAPLVISNQVFSASFDALGFMNSASPGRTVLEVLGETASADVTPQASVLAVIRSHVADAHPLSVEDCRGYVQEFDRLTGTLITTYDLYGPTRITAYTSLEPTNLLVYRIERTPSGPGRVLHLEVEADTTVHQPTSAGVAGAVAPTFIHRRDDPVLGHRVEIHSLLQGRTVRWMVQCPGAKLEVRGTHVHVRLDSRPDGSADHTLLLWVERSGGADDRVLAESPQALRSAHENAWQAWWTRAWMLSPQPSGVSKARSIGRWAGDVRET